ncbi:MAG: response regulator [Lachnospiraceae bacterium]|nr:response regulator [Lachnospiraceae bacterium]
MEHQISLTDLISVDMLQSFQDSMTEFSGMASVILDDVLNPITVPNNFTNDFVNNIALRKKDKTVTEFVDCAEKCLKTGKICTYKSGNGLLIMCVPFICGNSYSGVFIGAHRTESKDSASHDKELSEILDNIYKLTASTVDILKNSEHLYSMTKMISEMAISRYNAVQSEMESYITAGKLEQTAQDLKKAADLRSDFLANMSHEIRTPMNAVLGMTEMAMREDLTPSVRQYLNQIKSSGTALLAIINDILDFSKIDSGKMDIIESEYEPLSIFYDTAGIIATRIGSKKIELLFDVDPSFPCRLMGDSQRIRQILINIANNAVKFTNKGSVRVCLSYDRKSDDEILMKVRVEDTGIGIKKEDLHKIFESFQQVDSKRNRNVEGTGLGLAICQRLLTLMNGSINVESEYEKGSVFSFSLPQKIIDDTPAFSVREKEEKMVAGCFSNKYLARQFYKDAAALGVYSCALIDHSYFDTLKENYADILKQRSFYVFVDSEKLTPVMDKIISDNPEIAFIEIASFQSNHKSTKKNLRIIRRPYASTSLAMALNNEEFHSTLSDESFEFDFIAPDAKILIVDDNEVNLNIAEGLLEPLKMKITRATGGKEALELVSKNMYDLIFMDHMMPEIDGIETTRVIRRMYKNYDEVPIIALTANVVEGTKDMFLSEGMNDYVPKPIEVHNLVNKVKKWLPIEMIRKAYTVEERSAEEDDELDLTRLGDLDGASAVKLLGSIKLYKKVLMDYQKAIPGKIEAITEALNTSDWPAYTVEVHALKSLSKQIGAGELAYMAAELEKAGNDRNTEFIKEYTEPMLNKYKRYEKFLGELFEDKQEVTSAEEKPEATSQILKDLFEQMTEALDNLDIDNMESAIGELDKYRYDEEQTTLFESLRAGVESIDIDKCDKIIDEWKALL